VQALDLSKTAIKQSIVLRQNKLIKLNYKEWVFKEKIIIL